VSYSNLSEEDKKSLDFMNMQAQRIFDNRFDEKYKNEWDKNPKEITLKDVEDLIVNLIKIEVTHEEENEKRLSNINQDANEKERT
jgi:transposase